MSGLKRKLAFGEYLAQLFRTQDIPSEEYMKINGHHPIEITFQVTEDCNMNCSYCYQHAKSSKRMTFETAKAVIDMILAADERTNKYLTSTKAQGVILSFIGGEPLLEIELIDQICDYFIKQCFYLQHPWATRYAINMTSNGLLYFDNRVQEFLQKHLNKCYIAITVDGCKELHDACRLDKDGNGTYDRAMAAAKHFAETLGGDRGSKMTLCPENIGYTAKAVKNLIENGYDYINLNCVYEEGWTVEHARILYKQIKDITEYFDKKGLYNKAYLSLLDTFIGRPMSPDDDRNWCGGTGLMLCVNWRGDFYPCVRYEESSLGCNREPYKIGDLETGIMNRPEYEQRVKCLGCITRRSQSTDECFNCPIASGCAWCTAYNYEITGTPDKRLAHICVMHKARVLGATYFWNKLYRKNGSEERMDMNIPKDWALEIVSEQEYNMLIDLASNGGGDEWRESRLSE